MAKILEKLQSTVIASVVLTVIMIIIVAGLWHSGQGIEFDTNWWSFLFRWLHVVSGIMWIGHLYYFNFTQIPTMPKIPAELKPAVSKHIAPAALFWFRWGAMATIATGIILALLNNYFIDSVIIGLSSGVPKHTAIGIGMWLGTIMWFNVWFVIWPNQQKALGLVQADDATKAKSARTAMLFSLTNTMLSLPMLYAMVAAQNIY